MTKIIDILQSEYSSEYYHNPTILNYSKPKIYPKIVTSKPVSSFTNKQKQSILLVHKRWYVYYNFRNPETGKFVRQAPIFFNLNRSFPDFNDRVKHIKIVRNSIEKLLKQGYSPYENTSIPKFYNAEAALKFTIGIKENTLKTTSLLGYTFRINKFIEYLTKKGLHKSPIINIEKQTINNYLNQVLQQTSPRNRNNAKGVLSSCFTVLEDNDLIARNFIKNIKNLKADPKRNKTYTLNQVNEIFKYLEDTDQQLLLFIKFVSYNFLRPIEVCRLQVKDIDIQNKQLKVRAKNKVVKTKIIPGILIDEIKALQIHKFSPNDFVITPYGISPWSTNEVNKREYFTKRYKKVKTKLKLSDDYTIYSFRHTFITKLYRELRSNFSKSETHDKLMLITGHSSLKSLQQYLRDIDAELPEDYSELLK